MKKSKKISVESKKISRESMSSSLKKWSDIRIKETRNESKCEIRRFEFRS